MDLGKEISLRAAHCRPDTGTIAKTKFRSESASLDREVCSRALIYSKYLLPILGCRDAIQYLVFAGREIGEGKFIRLR